MSNKKYFYQSLTVICVALLFVVGWVYLAYSTTIGADIETVNFLATGTSTLATTTIGTNFYVDETGNASTSGTFTAADASTTATLVVGSTLTVAGESNLSTLVSGGATTSLSTTSPPSIVDMTAAQFCDNAIMFFANNEDTVGSTTTMYMPNASQLIGDCIPAVGDMKSTFLILSTTDTASTTITASTSINMLKGTAEGDLVLDIFSGSLQSNGSQAQITCYNKNGTEVDCIFNSFLDGD